MSCKTRRQTSVVLQARAARSIHIAGRPLVSHLV